LELEFSVVLPTIRNTKGIDVFASRASTLYGQRKIEVCGRYCQQTYWFPKLSLNPHRRRVDNSAINDIRQIKHNFCVTSLKSRQNDVTITHTIFNSYINPKSNTSSTYANSHINSYLATYSISINSWFPTWIALPLVLGATFSLISLKKKQTRFQQNTRTLQGG
jgi:hypothetical protein